MDQTLILLSFSLYLAVLFIIGWKAYSRTSDLGDFVLGGRRLGSWVAALSAGASDMSGWLLLGLPGYAYLSGIESVWLAGGLLAGTWLNWRLVAARLRAYSSIAGDSITLPAFFGNRFRDDSGLLQLVSAVFILMFFLFYTSSGLVAGGKLFETVFGLDYVWAVAVGALAIILYTSLGGFLAVSWTDLLQALLMAAALLIVPVMAIQGSGGVSELVIHIQQKSPELLNPFTSRDGEALTVIAIVSLLGWGLGYFGQPHILARFKGIESVGSVPKARRIAVVWTFLTLSGATASGLLGIGFFEQTLAGADSERVFIQLIGALFHPLVAGILLAAILAAIMSTADSQLLVSSSAFTEDIYKQLFKKRCDSANLVLLGRIAVVVIAAIAFVLALNPDSKVLELVSYAWAGFGAAFGPTLILALYWRRMTRNGALAGIICGGITVVVWKQLQGGVFDLYEIVPGCALSFLAIVIFTLLDKEPGAEICDEFAQMEKVAFREGSAA
jgi:sodium/proline symporter